MKAGTKNLAPFAGGVLAVFVSYGWVSIYLLDIYEKFMGRGGSFHVVLWFSFIGTFVCAGGAGFGFVASAPRILGRGWSFLSGMMFAVVFLLLQLLPGVLVPSPIVLCLVLFVGSGIVSWTAQRFLGESR